MPTILLRKEHRADHLTNVEQASFSRALWVIDLQPDMLFDEAASIDGGLAKCSSCSFVSFLSGVPERSQYVGLDPLAATFGAAHELTSAAKRGDSASVLRMTSEMGAAAIFEVVSDREREQRLLPAIEAISRHERSPAPRDGTSWALVEPDAEGPSGLSGRIRMKVAAGYRRILVGYLDHAVATERWNAFVERDEFDDEWLSFLLEMRALSIEQLVFSMSYPPCSSLQWRANRPLEARRARLDQHFRVVSGDASLMCAENVSGYALLNDNRELDSTRAAMRQGVRHQAGPPADGFLVALFEPWGRHSVLAEAELHSEIEALRERNRELESDLKRAEGQCGVLENFVFGIEQEYEKAQRELTSAKRELSASLEDVRKKEAVVRALGTPILDIWDDVIVLPIIGAVDPDRAATMTEALLSRIVERRTRCVIVDLTGVEQVDSSTAEHLLRLLHSTRLLGAFGVLTGIGPQIAATIVELGVDFGNVRTLRTLREGLRICMDRLSKV